MGKNRLPNPVMYQPKAEKQEEIVLTFSPCLQCQKEIGDGFYGRHTNPDGGTCSKECEIIYDSRERYPLGVKREGIS